MANYMVSRIKWLGISKWDFQLVLEVQGSTNSIWQRLASSHQNWVRSSSKKCESYEFKLQMVQWRDLGQPEEHKDYSSERGRKHFVDLGEDWVCKVWEGQII